MDLEKVSKRHWWRTWKLYLLLAVIVVVIVVIVVPLAVLLPRHHHSTPAATVILPLYIYPTSDALWSPLFDALAARPDLNFTIIVNPQSGPGPSPYPGDAWAGGVAKLNAYDNVRTVGYIPTHYAARNLSDVLADVATYAGWALNSTSIAVDGIFFDEAPYVYSASAAEYMRTIDAVVKNTTGFMGERTVIHNPGTIPDAGLNDTNLDVVVVFEDDYSSWLNRSASVEALPQVKGSDRANYSVMINSLPASVNKNKATLESFVDSLSKVAEYIFVTNSTQNFYESFSSDWLDFVAAMPTNA